MSESRVEIEAVCEIHQGSGRVVVRHEGDRVVLDACQPPVSTTM